VLQEKQAVYFKVQNRCVGAKRVRRSAKVANGKKLHEDLTGIIP
jgi:hypothetical protein